MRTSSTHLLVASAASILIAATSGQAQAQDSERVLTVPFPDVGQVCLDETQTADVTRDIKNLVLPAGSTLTLIAYSDKTEIAGRRFEEQPDCVKRAIPIGIGDHERIALLRALQLVEIGDKLGVAGFSGTPMLVIGSNVDFRQGHTNGLAIVAKRSNKSGPNERRVEIWASQGADSVAASAPGQTGGVTVLTPILLPPSSYAGGNGGSTQAAPEASTETSLRDETGLDAWQWLGWSMVGGGAAIAIAGGFAYASADSYEDRSREELDRGRSITFQDRADELYQDSGWAIGIGTGLALMGGVLLVSLPAEPDSPSVAIGTSPVPGGGVITVGLGDMVW